MAAINDSSLRIATIAKYLKEKRKRNRKARRFWKRPCRTSAWWENFVKDVVVPEEWREHFRISKKSFMELSNQLRPFLLKQVTNMRRPISLEMQLAVTLYYLSDEGRMRKVANAFGIP
eukprot:gene15583-17157_t